MDGYLLLPIARWVGLFAMFIIIFQMLSMGKGRTLETLVNKQRLVNLHRKGVWSILFLIPLHASLVVYGRSLAYEDSTLTTLRDFYLDGQWGSLTGIGILVLLFALTMSVLFLYKKILFPAFKRTHWLMYVAVPMLFFHQIFFGLDFVSSKILCVLWIVLCSAVAADILIWKVRLKFARR
ncbi:MAG: ferric reductase-like transmembrane domain-containing protein [bacterium]